MIGKLRDIGIEYIEKTNTLFRNSVISVDSAIRRKLRIKGPRVDVHSVFMARKT